MTNEMANSNTSGLKDEESNVEETCKASMVISALEYGTTEEYQIVAEVEGKKFHDEVANLASNDPKKIGDPSVENQASSIEEHQNDEAHPIDEIPKMTTESTAAEEIDSNNRQLEPSLNDSVQEKPIERNMEESELQGTMQNQLEKQDFFKNEETREDGTISPSHDLEPQESSPIEAGKASLLDSTQEIDGNEENQIPAELEGHVLHEEVAYSATDDRNVIEDSCIENLSSSIKDLEEDKEDEIIIKSDDLEPKENVTVEACQIYLVDSTPITSEENERVAEVEEFFFHENTAYSAIDEHKMIADFCTEDQTSRTKDSQVPPVDEVLQDTLENLESTESKEEDSKVQAEMLSSDSGYKEPIEQNNKYYAIQGGTMQYQLEKQVSLKKENEEDGTISAPHDLEDKENKSSESNQLELVTVPAYQSVEVGSETLKIKECQRTNFNSAFEAYGHVLDTDTMQSMELGADDSSSDPAMEPKEEALSLKSKVRDEQLKSFEDPFEAKDGEEHENGFSNETLPSSYDDVGVENKYNVDFPTTDEVNVIDNANSEQEALELSSSHFEVSEPKDRCIAVEEGIRPPDKESESEEEKHYTNQIQPCIQSRMESEPDCDKSSGATMGEPTQMIDPLCNIDFQTDQPEFVEACKVVHICLIDQHEASEDRCYTDSSINHAIKTSKKDNAGDFLATENPTIDFTTWIAEELVSMNNLEAEMLGQQVTQHLAKVAAAEESETSAEAEISSLSTSSGSETQQTAGRSSTVSTESDTDNLHIVHDQIQKSPSFSLDLRNEAKTEESDSTPLLFHEKPETLSTLIQCEKVITLARSESTTPFLGDFLKEEEEKEVAVKNILENYSSAESSTKNKGKEKRKHCPSVFSNCFCCSNVAN